MKCAAKLESGRESRAKPTRELTQRPQGMRSNRKLYVLTHSLGPLNQRPFTDTKIQNFGTDGVILTGIYGNDSKVIFENIEGTGKPQWVSFYHQSKSIHPSPIQH